MRLWAVNARFMGVNSYRMVVQKNVSKLSLEDCIGLKIVLASYG